MDAIAAHAGVSKPVLYRYFADKSQLWQAVGQEAAAMLVGGDRAGGRGGPGGAGGGRARRWTRIWRYIEADPHVYRFVVHQPRHRARPRRGRRRGGHRGQRAGPDPRRPAARRWAWTPGRRCPGRTASSATCRRSATGGCGTSSRSAAPALSDYLTTFLWSGVAGIRTAADVPGGLAAR